jgi:putative SOS response-associated peptidase YedK
MCYSNSSTSTTQQLAERYQKLLPGQPFELKYYFASGFQFPEWPIVTNDQLLQQMRWGLLPRWFSGSNPVEFASKTLNARLESAAEKASFKHLLTSNRCLVPSTGFFEWQTNGKMKQPYMIQLQNEPIFSIAGLHDTWLNPSTGQKEQTFTILTTQANSLMAEIHNTKLRMPLVLQPNEEKEWLAGVFQPAELFDRSSIQLEAWPVDKQIILGPHANQAAAHQRYYSPIGQQKSLFD